MLPRSVKFSDGTLISPPLGPTTSGTAHARAPGMRQLKIVPNLAYYRARRGRCVVPLEIGFGRHAMDFQTPHPSRCSEGGFGLAISDSLGSSKAARKGAPRYIRCRKHINRGRRSLHLD